MPVNPWPMVKLSQARQPLPGIWCNLYTFPALRLVDFQEPCIPSLLGSLGKWLWSSTSYMVASPGKSDPLAAPSQLPGVSSLGAAGDGWKSGGISLDLNSARLLDDAYAIVSMRDDLANGLASVAIEFKRQP